MVSFFRRLIGGSRPRHDIRDKDSREGTRTMAVKSDIEIAREAKMKPIAEVGAKIGIPANALLQYGPTKAKVSFDFIEAQKAKKDGKLILVTAITPTPA